MAVTAAVAALSSPALPAAPAAAAQCVNLTGERDWDGLYFYAEVKNICSGTYHFRIKSSDGVNIGCYATPTGIQYC